MLSREEAHISCLSRDCICVNGKDIDSNCHETIDNIYDSFEQYIVELESKYIDLEYNFSCVLDHATSGRASHPNIELETAYMLININIDSCIKEALDSVSNTVCNNCEFFDKDMFCDMGRGTCRCVNNRQLLNNTVDGNFCCNLYIKGE